MSRVRLEFQRRFQLWTYSVTHCQLLLRSNRSNVSSTRIDVLFKDVSELRIPTSFMGLVIEELSEEERPDLKIDPRSRGRKYFRVRGEDFSGFVASGEVFWHEDEGYHYDKSYFSDSFASLSV